MTVLLGACLFFLGWDQPQPNFFGLYNHRQAIDVAADIDAVGGLPETAIWEVEASLLEIVRAARPIGLRIRAMDLVSQKGSPSALNELMAYLNAALDKINSDADIRERETGDAYILVGSFLDYDPARWGATQRSSPATISFLVRIAKWRGRPLDESNYRFALEALIAVLPSDAEKRSVLLEVVSSQGGGALAAIPQLVERLDQNSLEGLRALVSRPGSNKYAVEVLGDAGDLAALPVLNAVQQVGQSAGDSSLVSACNSAIRKINCQNPTTKLLDAIRTSSSDNDAHFKAWAVGRAVKLGLDKADIRVALLDWSRSAEEWQVAIVRESALHYQVLQPSDLPNIPERVARRFIGCGSVVERRAGPVPIPDRRTKKAAWRPNENNYEPFSAWFASQDWETISDERGVEMIHTKMCELDLLHPDTCVSAATSQPAQ